MTAVQVEPTTPPAGRTPGRRLAAGRRKLTMPALHVLFVAAILGVWQYASGRWIDPLLVASPSTIAVRLYQWLGNGTLWQNLRPTLIALLAGFVIGVIVALAAAVLFVEVAPLGRFFETYILALGAVPFVALAPLLIIWFGLGLEPKIVVAALTTFCSFFANAFTGLRETSPDLLELGRILHASRRQRLTKIQFWDAMPYLISGVKQSLPRAVFAVIVIEFLASNKGLGYLITSSGNNLDMPGLFGAVLVLVIVTQGLLFLVRLAEQRLLVWQPRERR
ncbi:MAG: ABC transporter permease [Actinobacteria bacterium]|nr:ABC transporter permease [Actinomycetota bacterium]